MHVEYIIRPGMTTRTFIRNVVAHSKYGAEGSHRSVTSNIPVQEPRSAYEDRIPKSMRPFPQIMT
jgi:hypothetical protein